MSLKYIYKFRLHSTYSTIVKSYQEIRSNSVDTFSTIAHVGREDRHPTFKETIIKEPSKSSIRIGHLHCVGCSRPSARSLVIGDSSMLNTYFHSFNIIYFEIDIRYWIISCGKYDNCVSLNDDQHIPAVTIVYMYNCAYRSMFMSNQEG